MIAIQEKVPAIADRETWQAKFLELLPRIERQLKLAFRHLDAEAHDEAVQDGIANCLQAFIRLCVRGCDHRAYASSLARFAIWQIKVGRIVGVQLNVRDPLSRYAQHRKGIRVERLEHYERESGGWVNAIVEDRRAPIPDQVALRIDVPAWMKTLPRRTRAIAADLAVGHSTSEVASKYGLSAARISQMRSELCDSWHQFQGEPMSSQRF